MNATKNLLTNLCNLLVCACEAFRYGLTFLRAILCSRAVLAAKLLAAESQVAACKQRIDSKKRRRPRFTASFHLLWVVLSKSLDKRSSCSLPIALSIRSWSGSLNGGLDECRHCGFDVNRKIMPNSDNLSQFTGHVLELTVRRFLRFFVGRFVIAFCGRPKSCLSRALQFPCIVH